MTKLSEWQEKTLTAYCLEKAAQAWCLPLTSKHEMDSDLALAFAQVLKREIQSERAASKAREAELVKALKFYAECQHYKVEKVYGQIIEYDVDAGPLRDIYEEVLPTEERGKTAREALSKYRNGGET